MMFTKDSYLNAFINDAIKILRENKTAICFYKYQVESLEKIMKVNITYNEENRWWEVKKK